MDNNEKVEKRTVIREYGEVALLQRYSNFIASSAAYMSNQNDLESAVYWSDIAVKAGIVFA